MGNSASGLPYSIGAPVATLKDGWCLCEGSRKSDGAAVSVFQAKKPAMLKTPLDPRHPNLPQAPVAQHHFQHCKKLRHPHILTVHATLDTDNPSDASTASSSTQAAPPSSKQTGDWIVVTEPCIPLQDWLDQNNPKPHEIAWGLQCVIEALVFLHNSAKLVHGNVSPDALVVTQAGDVKLWSFGLVCPVENIDTNRHFLDYQGLVCPNAYQSLERREARWDAVSNCAVHAMDSYSVGILIAHLYNDNIPPPLQKAVQRLQTNNIRARPRLAPLLKCPVFNTPYQQAQTMLDELSVQPVEAKVAFWQSLPNLLQQRVLDEPVAKYKILPLMQQTVQTISTNEGMMSQDLYRREVLAILPPLFFIAETYLANDSDLFNKELTPIVARLFGVNDRGVRGALLGRISLLSVHMDKHQLNTKVFEPMCSGFSDSSPALRELTLKATIVLVPHLTAPNLEKLSRYLVRLQADPETSIRTNTVIFICKLAPSLSEMNRQKMLLPAYVRAMKDGFEPCRLAALQSLMKSQDMFHPQDVAHKVLPAVMPTLLDPAAGVRREAFSVTDSFLQVLKQEDQKLAAAQAANPTTSSSGIVAPQPSTTVPASGAVAPAPTSGGYLSGFSSWMSSSAKPQEASGTPAAPTAAVPNPPPYNAAPASAPYNAAPPAMSGLSLTANNNNTTNEFDDFGGDNDDGWGDDDVDLLDIGDSPVKNKPLVSPSPAMNKNAWKDESEDDFFSSFDTTKPKPAKIRSSGGKLAVPAKKTAKSKPEIKKLAMDDDNDGWDDF